MRLVPIAPGLLVLCLAAGTALAAGGVECDAERGVCWKRTDGKIERSVEETTGGIVAEITSKDAQTALRIGKQLAEATERFERGHAVPASDAFFSALAGHRHEISLAVTEIEGGVRISATSGNPRVTTLIRQHAAKGLGRLGEKEPGSGSPR